MSSTSPSSAADDGDLPITGPAPKGPDHPWEPDPDRPGSFALLYARFWADVVRKPTRWFRENIVEPNKGPKYYWYHRKYGRPLPIDECYYDDFACIYEADLDYKRGLQVDRETLNLLRYRRDSCYFWYATSKGVYYPSEKCKPLSDTYDREEINFFLKHSEMNYKSSVLTAYNKQKHRMIVERRKALKAEAEAAAAAEESENNSRNNATSEAS